MEKEAVDISTNWVIIIYPGPEHYNQKWKP